MPKTIEKLAASTTQLKTADDLRVLEAQIAVIQQQQEQAKTELTQWGQQLTGEDADRALAETTRLRAFVIRMEADIERIQVEAEALAESFKSAEQKAIEKAAAELQAQQDKRKAEIIAQLPKLIADFNSHSDGLKERWLVLKGLLTEESQISRARDERAHCLLGGFPLNEAARIFQVAIDEERGHFRVMSEEIPLIQIGRPVATRNLWR